MQPASVDNELICNVNYIKHPPRQHLCVSVFNLKRLSLKMSFSIKSLDSIYISCIRVNLCLTQSINHCQGVLCLYLSSSPTPLPSSSHPCTFNVEKAVLDTLYKWQSSQFSGQRLPSAGGVPAQRGVQCGHLAGAEEGGGREVLPSFCWLLWKDLPREGALSLVAPFQHVFARPLKESMA